MSNKTGPIINQNKVVLNLVHMKRRCHNPSNKDMKIMAEEALKSVTVDGFHHSMNGL